MAERWRPVKGYEGKYIVSSKGNVMSVPRTYTDKLGRDYMVDGITLTKCDDARGYDRVRFGDSGMMRVHRLVAEAFIPNPLNLPEVNHKDGNKKNNCAENLEWVTHQENMIHAVETGLFGERAKKATPEIVAAIRAEYVPHSREHGTMALGKKYGIDPAYVWRRLSMDRGGKGFHNGRGRADGDEEDGGYGKWLNILGKRTYSPFAQQMMRENTFPTAALHIGT